MIFGDVDIEIIELFSKNLVAFYSINQIAKLLNKTYPYVNKRVSYLIGEGILKKVKLGAAHLCSLNLSNDKTILLLSLTEIEKREEFIKKNTELGKALELLEQERRNRTIHCAFLHNNTIFFVLEDPQFSIEIQGFQTSVINKDEFLKLVVKGDVLKEHIILYGSEKYFQFIKEVERELKIANMPI